MSNHAPSRSIIDCRIGIGIEYRWLQNSSRENDVAQWTIISVVSLRRHAPVRLVHWTVKAPAIEIPVRLGSPPDISNQIVFSHHQLRIVARMIRVTDLNSIGVEFL